MVIGGGVIGLSIAHHLGRAGVRDVVLVEQGELGSGSTCKAAGGVRATFSDAVNIELGLRSLRAFETFAADIGQEIDLHQVGYLFLLDRPEHVAAFEHNVALQNELGGTSRMVDVAEAKRLSPLIETEGLLAAAWSPYDGHCTPEAVVLGYAGAARRAGRPAGPRLLRDRHRHPGRRHHRGGDQPRHRSAPRSSCARPAPGRRSSATWWASTCRWCRCAGRSSPPSRSPASTRGRRSRSSSRPASTSTARARGCCSGCPTRTRRPASSWAAPTTGCRGSARRSSAGRRRSPRWASPAGGPGSTR